MVTVLFGKVLNVSSASKPKEITRDQIMWERTDRAKEMVIKLARDPDSVIFDEEYFSKTEDVVCLKYRGKNGFGGVVRGVAVYREGQLKTDVKTFNSNCAA